MAAGTFASRVLGAVRDAAIGEHGAGLQLADGIAEARRDECIGGERPDHVAARITAIGADRALARLTALTTLQTFTRGALTVFSVVIKMRPLPFGSTERSLTRMRT